MGKVQIVKRKSGNEYVVKRLYKKYDFLRSRMMGSLLPFRRASRKKKSLVNSLFTTSLI